MVLYNTLVGVAAGLALVLVPRLGRTLVRGESASAEGWAIALGTLGLTNAVLGGLIAVTWPLAVKPQVNILFGEPTSLLGVLLLGSAAYLWRHPRCLDGTVDEERQRLLQALRPLSWVVFGLGLVLLSCCIAVFRFTAIGAAPPAEPIVGVFAGSPWVENTLMGALYALSAVATLLAPWAARDLRSVAAVVSSRCAFVAGVVLLPYSAMNYYTHIGLLMGQ